MTKKAKPKPKYAKVRMRGRLSEDHYAGMCFGFALGIMLSYWIYQIF